MPTYELTTKPGLSTEWQQVTAQEQAHTLIANRSTSAKIRFEAKVKLGDLRARRVQLEQDIVDAARVITVERVQPKVWGRVVSQRYSNRLVLPSSAMKSGCRKSMPVTGRKTRSQRLRQRRRPLPRSHNHANGFVGAWRR